VKLLAPFPQILRMMDDRLDWMQKLGNAFLAQQNEVMDSASMIFARAFAAIGFRPRAVCLPVSLMPSCLAILQIVTLLTSKFHS
jgi:hypothetical protein